jgi:hypothetical protein
MFYVFISPAILYLRMKINKCARVKWLDTKCSRLSGGDHDFKINAYMWGFQNTTSTETWMPYISKLFITA